MTKSDRQARLDKLKWIESEEQGVDMSGCMEYCDYCKNCEDLVCKAIDTRVEENLCALAYNRMKRSGR